MYWFVSYSLLILQKAIKENQECMVSMEARYEYNSLYIRRSLSRGGLTVVAIIVLRRVNLDKRDREELLVFQGKR